MLAYKAPAVGITEPMLLTTLGRVTPTLGNLFPGRWGDFGPSLGIRFIRLSLGAAAVSVPVTERYILTSRPPVTTGVPPATAL